MADEVEDMVLGRFPESQVIDYRQKGKWENHILKTKS